MTSHSRTTFVVSAWTCWVTGCVVVQGCMVADCLIYCRAYQWKQDYVDRSMQTHAVNVTWKNQVEHHNAIRQTMAPTPQQMYEWLTDAGAIQTVMKRARIIAELCRQRRPARLKWTSLGDMNETVGLLPSVDHWKPTECAAHVYYIHNVHSRTSVDCSNAEWWDAMQCNVYTALYQRRASAVSFEDYRAMAFALNAAVFLPGPQSDAKTQPTRNGWNSLDEKRITNSLLSCRL